jgi:hypothetical protein
MRVSYDEGLASHIGSESCTGIREDTVEALTGVCAGWVSSLENSTRSADGLRPSEGNTGRIAIARFVWTPRGLRPHARTQAPHKRRLLLRNGSREVPGLVPMVIGARAVNPKGARRR